MRAGTRWSVIPSRLATQITAWTESITTAAVGCGLKSADTLPESFTDGGTPGRPSQTGYGRNLILPLTFRPARNTSPPTRRIRSLATIGSLHGIRLSFKRSSRRPCGTRKWIQTISQNDFPRGSMDGERCDTTSFFDDMRSPLNTQAGDGCELIN